MGNSTVIIEQGIAQQKRFEPAKLAVALVDSLGLEGAIFACRANGWDGILEAVRSMKVEELPDTGQPPYHV
jgi:hypothetical protein